MEENVPEIKYEYRFNRINIYYLTFIDIKSIPSFLNKLLNFKSNPIFF